LRQVDQQPSGDRHLGGEARALGADGILHHLHQDRLPFGERLLDRLVLVVADVGHVQERGARQADFDER
jgi:hypothetical protein